MLVPKRLFLPILRLMACCLVLMWKRIVEMAKATGKDVIASGGVSSLADLDALQNYEADGVIGAIVGKALYTNRFTVKKHLKR